MDLRTLTKLLLKLVGLYLLVSILLSLPPLLAAPEQLLIGNLAYLAVYVIAGLLLFWFPGVIINRVIRIEGMELEGSVTASRLLRVGTILLGFYFAVSAAYGLIFTWAKFNLFYRLTFTFPGSAGPEMTPDDFAYVIAMAMQLLLGVALWFGSRFIVRLSGGFDGAR